MVSATKKDEAKRVDETSPSEKGAVIAGCGVLGIDWERISLSAYLEACEAQ